MTFWNRTDYFTCGHSHIISGWERRDERNEKCPKCSVGDYQYSSVATDEKEQPESRPQPEYWPSAEGERTGYWTFQGTPIQPPPNVTTGTGATVGNIHFENGSTIQYDDRSLYPYVLMGSDSPYTEVLSEEHPFPDSTHYQANCSVCQRLINHQGERDGHE